MRGLDADNSRQLGASSAVVFLVILLVLLVGATTYLLVTYYSQNSVLESREEELSRAQYDIRRLSDSLEEAEREKQSVDNALNALQRKVGDLQTQQDGELNALQERVRLFDTQKQQYESRLEALRQKNAEQEDLAAELGKAKQRIAELEQLSQKLQECETRLETSRNALEAAQQGKKTKSVADKEALARLKKELETCRSELKEVAARKTATSAPAQELPAAAPEKAAGEAADKKLLEAAAAQRAALETQVAELKTQVAESKTNLVELQKTLETCQADLGAARESDTPEEVAEVKKAYESLIRDLKQEINAKEVTIEQFQDKVKIQIIGKILFPSGSSQITPNGREFLGKFQETLGKVKHKRIFVVGHTDDVDIKAAYLRLVPSNWELSARRAAAVVRYLINEGGVRPERLAAVGRSHYEPVGDNDTREGRARNRRVEIIVSNDLHLSE